VYRLKTAVQSALFLGGFYDVAAAIRQTPHDRLLVVMYHDIADDSQRSPGPGGWVGRLTRAHFEAQVRAFTKWYRVLTVGRALAEMNEPRGLHERTIAITFDDGYQSVYGNAFPILAQYGVAATIFPLTDWINGRMGLWWETTYRMIVNTGITSDHVREMERILGHDLPKASDFDLREPESRKVINRRVEALLRSETDQRRDELLSQLQTLLDPESGANTQGPPALSWEQMREMAAAGFEFGCHTRSHVNLGSAPLEVAERELTESKAELESRIGAPIRGLAFPYGSHDSGYAHVEPLLKKLGFAYACTTFAGVNDQLTNRYALRRATLPCVASMSIIGRTLAVEFMDGHGNSSLPGDRRV
jgi:peptidoglycan/xylan/chitin deacetylase (PgdA/CDA1 family)